MKAHDNGLLIEGTPEEMAAIHNLIFPLGPEGSPYILKKIQKPPEDT